MQFSNELYRHFGQVSDAKAATPARHSVSQAHEPGVS